MADTHHTAPQLSKFEAPAKLKTMAFALIAIGLITFVIGLMKNQDRLWTSYLVSFFFFSCMGLGGLFWAALQNLSKAGWSVSTRRLAESMTSFIPVMIVGSLILL